jgi:hypothetical protein
MCPETVSGGERGIILGALSRLAGLAGRGESEKSRSSAIPARGQFRVCGCEIEGVDAGKSERRPVGRVWAGSGGIASSRQGR